MKYENSQEFSYFVRRLMASGNVSQQSSKIPVHPLSNRAYTRREKKEKNKIEQSDTPRETRTRSLQIIIVSHQTPPQGEHDIGNRSLAY